MDILWINLEPMDFLAIFLLQKTRMRILIMRPSICAGSIRACNSILIFWVFIGFDFKVNFKIEKCPENEKNNKVIIHVN